MLLLQMRPPEPARPQKVRRLDDLREDVASGELLAYVGSAKTIEIAVRDGSADERLGVERGTQILPGAGAVPYR